MKVRKIPMRTCVVTKEKLPKQELIRIVKTDAGVIYDSTGKVNGRGAYLKKDKDVFERARKSKVLEKYLETTISSEFYDELDKILD
ncbi:MAG TPA: YlxR family protein [Candidatus Coprosoma intestinipullorum]|uniref:YlxR family protein n=1 Tax=Candidatus Coprosoma intestinipullorum TaxID=2840752 RepID=A0A9D0ZRM2_9FIRM|nr:YlxR family protein [Candidatus Coprosoma intestinipullorum]